jgi:hypothetical protein
MPVRQVLLSTATGIQPTVNGVDFGGSFRHATYSALNASTVHTFTGTVQGAVGGSEWYTILTLGTGNSTGVVATTGTDLLGFDKLRFNLSANLSTAATPAWLAASD